MSKMIDCKKCGKRMAKGVKFCPHCGDKYIKPFYQRWWFITLAIFAVCIVLLNSCGAGEKIEWDDVILGDLLPEPPNDRGEIHTNAADGLWVDIFDISAKDFDDYIEVCKVNGFNADIKYYSSHFEAYNAEGYKLTLSYYGSSEELHIDLDVPMEMATIVWPTGTIGKQLPIPKSAIGKISYERSDEFLVYIGNTTMTDYTEYVNACIEKGFVVNYEKGEKYYRADNSEGWNISISYEGGNVMRIRIEAPVWFEYNEVVVPSTEPATQESEPNVTEIVSEAESSNSGIGSDFKAAMETYEAFIDEYVAVMKRYKENPTDISVLSDYTNYISKYAELLEAFNAWNAEDLNNEDLAYYIEVQTRVSQKLIDVAQ